MTQTVSRRTLLHAGGLLLAGTIVGISVPEALAAPAAVELIASDGRIVAVTHWRPARRAVGTILFSHGALSSPAAYDLLILPWVDAGYAVWAPLHVDSLAHPRRADFPGLKSWAARIEDMQLLARHVGAKSWIAAGHSYGGLVALTMGGASPVPPPGYSGTMAAPGVSAVVAFSPPGPMPGLVEPGSYASLAVPAFIQSGTRDLVTAPGTQPDPASWRKHLMAYDEARAGGHRYALVLEGVDHYFGGAICDFAKPGPRRIAEAGTAAMLAALFMDGYGQGKRSARRRLDARLSSSGPVILLAK